MKESVSTAYAVKWTIFTIVTALGAALFAANVYIAAWYVQQATAGTPHQSPPPVYVIQRGTFLVSGVGLWFTVFLWWLLHRKTDPFSVLFNTRTARIGPDVGIGILIGGAWVAVYGAIGWPSFSSMFVVDAAKLESLPTSLSAGFCEEFLFRGFIILLIARAGGGKRARIVWSSLAFGMAHIMWGPVGMLFTVALGLSFAWITLRRGNVWAAVTAHTLLDLCIEPGLFEKAMSYGQ